MKKVLIAVIAIIIVVVIAVFIVNAISLANKNYTLEEIKESDYKYFSVYTDGKYGVLDENGKMIIKNNYKNVIIPNPTKAVFICLNDDGGYETLNEKGEKIFTNFNNVREIEENGTNTSWPYEKSVLMYEEGGKYGIIDYEGKQITKAIYEEIASVKYKDGEILAKKDGKYGVINNKGNVLISFDYDEIEGDKYYEDGYEKSGYIVKNKTESGYRCGYINYKWKKLLNTDYISISRILDINDEDVYLIASKGGQYGVMKNKGEQIEFAYQSISYNRDTNLLAVQKNEKYGVINLNGEVIVPLEYRSIRFSGVYICARGYEDDTYFNEKGQEVTNGYTGMKKISNLDCYITTDKNNLYGLADKDGKVLVANSYLYIDYAFDKYFIAYKEGQGLGVIDKDNKIVIDFGYNDMSRIGDKDIIKGVKMGTDGDSTTIFAKGLKVVDTMTNMSIVISADYVEIYNNEKEIFIDNNGEIKKAQDIFDNNKLFAVINNGKWGYQNKDGEIKVACTYDFVTEFNRFGFAGINKDGLWGIIDETGNVICECIFDFEENGISPEFLGKYYRTHKENNEIYYSDAIVSSGEGI